MRLRKIKIRNIASLRGEHVVDFGEIAGHSALFAITGETGSGKSTILNSIGLALYGKFFKKTVYSNDVVTLGEKEGSVELIFELKGKTFLSTWRIKVRKNNGEELAKTTPERGFFILPDDEFDSQREPSPVPIEESLSLDFEQFTKCVVLNQGEFAKFLMSTFSERRSILEKLCPGQVFDSLTAELNRELKIHADSQRDLMNSLRTLQEENPSETNLEENLQTAERELGLSEKWLELVEKLDDKFATLYTYYQQNADYLNRIKITESDITSQTTVYNELLKKTGDLQKIKEEKEADLSKREPRLLELLKLEENLTRDKKTLEKHVFDEEKTKKELEASDSQIKKLEREEKVLKEKKTELAGKLQFSYEPLLSHRHTLEEAFSLQNNLEHLSKDISVDRDKLSEASKKGSELAEELKRLTARLEEIPSDLDQKIKALEEKKVSSEKARARAHELGLRLEKTEKTLLDDRNKLTQLEAQIKLLEEKRVPLLANLKIKELLSAVAVCILHPETSSKGNCPVCETPFVAGKLEELRILVEKSDPRKIQDEETKLRDEVTRIRAEKDHLAVTISKNEKVLTEDKAEKEKLVLSSEDDSDKLLETNRKLLWERDEILPKKQKQDSEIEKARLQYGKIRDELRNREANETKKKVDLSNLVSKLPPDLPFTPENLPRLKADLSVAHSVADLLSQLKEITTHLDHLKTRTKELSGTLEIILKDRKTVSDSIEKGMSVLKTELNDESAVSVHNRLKLSAENSRKEYDSKEIDRRKQENILRDFQGKLITYKDQVKEIEVLYSNAHENIRSLMAGELPELSQELSTLKERLRVLDLPLSSPAELFIPLKDLILSKKTELKTKTNEARSTVVRLKTQKDEFEKRRDRIRMIEMKLADVNSEIHRWERLSKILGKDELRTYVLSLVEENLIIVTNEELSRLCQGRYEIIHQNKGAGNTPEFFILDKFRDGGIRKISTLSGGETFMVSLAMALGLAEMTRGQAEIDTLFIDEGFGTLDQDSLEDVLDVLNQIQTRGLMIGIISHVKTLTDVIPVNLVLSKKRDGTSSVAIRVH